MKIHDEKTPARDFLGRVFAPKERERFAPEELQRMLLEEIPELAALDGIPQHPEYHAEGDALTHTFLALQAVSADADERVFWAVLLHDVGKAPTTTFRDGRWRSPGHEVESEKMVPGILRRLGRENLAEDVAWLVRHHGFPLSWSKEPLNRLSPRQRRFCRHPLFSLLIEVARADVAGSLGRSDKGERLAAIEALCRFGEDGSGES